MDIILYLLNVIQQLYKQNCFLVSTTSSAEGLRRFNLRFPRCNNALVHKKDRKLFIVHKCVNPKCSYYLNNLKKVSKKEIQYKLF